MPRKLVGKTVAILATDGFEEVELFEPLDALERAGATVEIISLEARTIQGYNHLTADRTVEAAVALARAFPDRYDALMLPGGVANPDTLRIEPSVQRFVRAFFDAGKPVGAICHAPWILIDAGVAKGCKMTGYKTIRLDLSNAGADVVDEEVVVDGNLTTSRDPGDLPIFCVTLIEQIAKSTLPQARLHPPVLAPL